MSVINVQVTDQKLKIMTSPLIASGGVNEDQVVFHFDPTWDEFGKAAIFYHGNKPDSVYESVIDAEGKAVVPHEVTAKEGKIYFGVCGVKDDIVLTSQVLSYEIVKGIYTAGEESEEPTPSVYTQMLTIAGQLEAMYNELDRRIDDIKPATDEQVKTAVDSWLEDHSGEIGGLSYAAKDALLNLLSHVAYTDANGQTYYNTLYNALYPPTNLVSISAVFDQGANIIYDTDSLDDLRQYLVVTANYDDQTSETVTNYTLSGTLAEGTSTITISYGGKTTTFDVNVTRNPVIDGTTLTWERGYIDANGNIAIPEGSTSDGGYTSDYYDVSGYQTALVALDGSSVQRNAYYDSNKTFISRVLTAESEIPNGAVYARASIVKNSLGNAGYDGTGTTITLS